MDGGWVVGHIWGNVGSSRFLEHRLFGGRQEAGRGQPWVPSRLFLAWESSILVYKTQGKPGPVSLRGSQEPWNFAELPQGSKRYLRRSVLC